MRIVLGVAAFAASLASPAHASWNNVSWDMTIEEAIAAAGGDFEKAKDEEDLRIHEQRRYAAGTEADGEITYDVSLYFDRKAKTLTMVLIEPQDKAFCDQMIADYTQRLGPVEIQTKEFQPQPGGSRLFLQTATWENASRGGVVDFSQATIEFSDYRHCQLLFQKRDFGGD